MWLCPKCDGQENSCYICDGQGFVTTLEYNFYRKQFERLDKTHPPRKNNITTPVTVFIKLI